MYNFKICEIITNSGYKIVPKAINVVIGPNNSGKSQFLKDIKLLLSNAGGYNLKNIVINEMNYILPNNLEDFIKRYNLSSRVFKNHYNQYYIRNYSGISNADISSDSSINSYLDSGNISVLDNWSEDLERQISSFNGDESKTNISIDGRDYPPNTLVHTEDYIEYSENGQNFHQMLGCGTRPLYVDQNQEISSFINTYGNLFFNYLGTEEKLLMCKRQKQYGSQDSNTNFLSEVQFNSKLLNSLAECTRIMFHKDIYLDRYSYGDSLLFRVGDNFDFIRNAVHTDGDVELKLKDYAPLDTEGDGIKSFVSSYLALHVHDKNILLLDEPESFLHPPLAKQLGEIIAESASSDKQIFISTHSVDLLKGILSMTTDVNIIRITRDGSSNDFNVLSENELQQMMSDSMLSSSYVLNGMFCEKVYICEAESDEDFFRNLHDKTKLYDSAFFTHAKCKQTIEKISRAYSKLKIPNCRIYDFDLLFDDGFNKALNGFVDDKIKNKYIDLCKQLRNVISKEDFHNGGVDKINDPKLRTMVLSMLARLRENNIIILEKGCLETSLVDAGIPYTENKPKWYADAIDKLMSAGEDELKNTYIYNCVFGNE